MSRASSPSSGRRYGTARVCRLWELPRSTLYASRARARLRLGGIRTSKGRVLRLIREAGRRGRLVGLATTG